MDKITPQYVVKAIVDCFYEAHCADTGLGGGEAAARQYCLSTVKKIFKEQGVDFDNPTKEGIVKAVNGLAEFSKNFRSQDIIEKHKQEIMDLLSRIE